MIKQLRVVGEHLELDDKLKAYVADKIGRLDRFLPRHARASAEADVMIRQERAKETGDYTVEAILHAPKDRLTAKASSTESVFAAVDLAENKLRHQLEKYKNEHSKKFYRHIINRLRRPRG